MYVFKTLQLLAREPQTGLFAHTVSIPNISNPIHHGLSKNLDTLHKNAIHYPSKAIFQMREWLFNHTSATKQQFGTGNKSSQSTRSAKGFAKSSHLPPLVKEKY